ncbi:conserved membrane hypothetical protein [uncultured Alphaproteobacteria bacterium]|jgi:membrane protein implicated in regulation of membrane protease activity|uniref:NfeD-like C-terminal domain-containing protein n=1 Tax=uncultured Alphaproteobacteria bacterium TaxID=91750 RepID=A0A212KKN0_9PROT|nr:conserved membrane hypothetical protein [uncultured Alphaproteobacteria bacterium]
MEVLGVEMAALPAWKWAVAGLALMALGSWRDWGILRAVGMGGLFTAMVAALTDAGGGEQLACWIGFSALSWVGGRRYRRRDAARAARLAEIPGFRLIGRRGTVATAFRNGHGTVEVEGETYAARADDNLPQGTRIRVVGADEEGVTVKAA